MKTANLMEKYLEKQNELGVEFVINELLASTLKKEEFINDANRLIGEKLANNHLVDNPSVVIRKEKDYMKLLDMIDLELDEEVTKYLQKYDCFESIIALLVLSGILSKMSFVYLEILMEILSIWMLKGKNMK